MIDTVVTSKGDAVFSANRLYRYMLTRELGGGRPLVVCGLNPSVANEIEDDPTITREIDFAQRWGCGRLVKVNAYAWVETKPEKMFQQKRKNHWDIVGPSNDSYLREVNDLVRTKGGILLVAWGKKIEKFRQQQLAELFGDIAMCIKTNSDGTPMHPLYAPKTSTVQPWKCP